MVGIPDGSAIVEQGDRIVYMDHELTNKQPGRCAPHGKRGAFVARLVVDPGTGRVKEGSDLIGGPLLRLQRRQLERGRRGPGRGCRGHTHQRLLEGSARERSPLPVGLQRGHQEGLQGSGLLRQRGVRRRGTGVRVSSRAANAQLPRLGLLSWENSLAAHDDTDRDHRHGQRGRRQTVELRVYNGTKQRKRDRCRQGRPDQRHAAGRQGRRRHRPHHCRAPRRLPKARSRSRCPEIDWTKNGVAQNVEADAKGTRLNRIEDCSRPEHPNDYYFLTTKGGVGADVRTGATGRDGGSLWRLTFTDVNRPGWEARSTLVLDGSESIGLNKPDNMMPATATC